MNIKQIYNYSWYCSYSIIYFGPCLCICLNPTLCVLCVHVGAYILQSGPMCASSGFRFRNTVFTYIGKIICTFPDIHMYDLKLVGAAIIRDIESYYVDLVR